MNVITFLHAGFKYSDGTYVMNKLNRCFKFGNVVSIEHVVDIEPVRKAWEGDNLTLLDYDTEVKNLRFGDITVTDMPPLSRKTLEELSLHRCHLYNMHRNEYLTFRKLDKEITDCFQYWHYVLDKYEIGLFLGTAVPHTIYDYSLYAVCKQKNIKVLYVDNLYVIQGYMYCHDDIYAKSERLEKAYTAALQESEPHAFSDFMQTCYIDKIENDCYRWMPDKRRDRTGQRLFTIKRGFSFIKKAYIRKITARHYRKLSCSADYSKQYIYIPLHMQPEATSSPLGNVFVDQLLMMKILSYCVKDTGIQLYVKEHPDQLKQFRLSRRTLYDNIYALPNVRLINIDESSHKLQENSLTTATLNGKVIMESLFKNKPILVFGSQFHNHAPNAYIVSDTESCKAALSDITECRFKIGKKERNAFLKALENVCYRGYILPEYAQMVGISQDDSAENTYLELKERIGEIL